MELRERPFKLIEIWFIRLGSKIREEKRVIA